MTCFLSPARNFVLPLPPAVYDSNYVSSFSMTSITLKAPVLVLTRDNQKVFLHSSVAYKQAYEEDQLNSYFWCICVCSFYVLYYFTLEAIGQAL